MFVHTDRLRLRLGALLKMGTIDFHGAIHIKLRLNEI